MKLSFHFPRLTSLRAVLFATAIPMAIESAATVWVILTGSAENI